MSIYFESSHESQRPEAAAKNIPAQMNDWHSYSEEEDSDPFQDQIDRTEKVVQREPPDSEVIHL